MTKKKRYVCLILSVVSAFCLLTAALFYGGTVPLRATAQTENSIWSGTQTSKNFLPVLSADSDIAGLGFTFSHNHTYQIHLTGRGSYGIRPTDDYDDIGDGSSYEGGMYYTYTLSETDRIKAAAGELSLSASSWYYIASWSQRTYISLNVSFYDANNGALGTEHQQQYNKSIAGASSGTEQLTLSSISIPAGTVNITFRWSAVTNGSQRPWVAEMEAYLTDKTSPSFENATSDYSQITDTVNNIAIEGDTVKYYLNFSEKISVAESGTAYLNLNGQQLDTSNTTTTLDNSGKASVEYTFVLPQSYSSGKLALSVLGLIVQDEAGNQFIYNGSPSLETLNYYGTMSVTTELSHLQMSGENTAQYGADYTAILSADKDYNLPSSVSVWVGGVSISGERYQYDSVSGTITVYGSNITGNISIKAAGDAKHSTVFFDKQKGSGGTDSETVIYDSLMPAISVPSRTGYTFQGYYMHVGGGGTKYYDASGKGLINCDFDETFTLYAYWLANTYTVIYNSNKPSTASGTVEGTTGSSLHTYDTSGAFTANGYTLTGWTFKDWAETSEGGVKYTDSQSIKNLAFENNAIVTLYAVWVANTYTVIYNSNKPSTASGTIEGAMSNSSHTYDTASPLKANGYVLTGWTFKGWATSAVGEKEYNDQSIISTLVTQSDGSITLYAVWEANTYTITLNSAGGSNSGKLTATYDRILPDIAAVPARYGYNFLGYFDAETGGTKYFGTDGKTANDKTLTVDENIVLYAQWSPVTYSVELYSEDRYIKVINEVEFGKLSLPSAQSLSLTRTNFDFVGWNMYDEQNWAMYRAGTSYSIGLTGEQGGVVVLYAAWQEKPLHWLIYDANGGIGSPAMIQVHEEETILLSSELPLRADYTFLGWTSTAASQTVEYLAGGEFTMNAESVTLYAVWKHNFSLSYNANGGSFADGIPVVYPAVGENVTLTVVKPYMTGYVFLGWSTNFDAAEAEYVAGGMFVMPEQSEGIVLYAVWEKEKYSVSYSAADGYIIEGLNPKYEYEDTAQFTVTGGISPKVYVNGDLIFESGGAYSFTVTGNTVVMVSDESKLSLIYDANGGSGQPADGNSYEQGSSATVSSQEPSRTGYTFLGWATSDDASSAQYSAGDNILFDDGDIVLYAVWKAHSYTVAYDANGGTSTMADSTHIFGTVSTLSENTFTKTGCSFVGWATERNGKVVYVDKAEVINLTAEESQVITLYAVWEKTVSSVRLISESENAGGFSVEFGGMPETALLVAPVRTGYIFCGYYTEDGGEGRRIFDENMEFLPNDWDINERSVSLFASWAPITYSVIYVNGAAEIGEPHIVEYGTPFFLNTVNELGIVPPANKYFEGWAVYPGSLSAVYNDGQLIENSLAKTDGAEVYLYAVFADNPVFGVNYDANGGNGVPTDQNLYYQGENVYFPSVIPERYGYIFIGWSDSPRDTVADYPYADGIFTIEYFVMPEGGKILYAVWQAGDTLQEQIAQMEAVLADLESSLNSLQGDTQNNAANIAILGESLSAAQNVINSLDDTYATDAELEAVKQELTDLIESAKDELKVSIEELSTELELKAAELISMIELKADSATVIENIAALEQAYKAADAAIKTEIGELKTSLTAKMEKVTQDVSTALEAQLDAAVRELQAALNTKADASDVTEKLAELEQAYKAADAALKTEIGNLEASLTTLMERKTAELQSDIMQLIDGVEVDLEESVKILNNAIALKADKSELEQNIADLTEKFAAADILLRNDFIAADSFLEEKLTALIEGVKSSLSQTIIGVQAELDNAIEVLRVEMSDADRTTVETLQSALNNLDAEYKAADVILKSELHKLQAQDLVIEERLSALEDAYKLADDALMAGLRKLQTALENLQTELNAKDSAIEEKVEILAADSSATAFVYKVINIIISCVAALLILTMIVYIVRNLKSKK